jgi:hypothetical protein
MPAEKDAELYNMNHRYSRGTTGTADEPQVQQMNHRYSR